MKSIGQCPNQFVSYLLQSIAFVTMPVVKQCRLLTAFLHHIIVQYDSILSCCLINLEVSIFQNLRDSLIGKFGAEEFFGARLESLLRNFHAMVVESLKSWKEPCRTSCQLCYFRQYREKAAAALIIFCIPSRSYFESRGGWLCAI